MCDCHEILLIQLSNFLTQKILYKDIQKIMLNNNKIYDYL